MGIFKFNINLLSKRIIQLKITCVSDVAPFIVFLISALQIWWQMCYLRSLWHPTCFAMVGNVVQVRDTQCLLDKRPKPFWSTIWWREILPLAYHMLYYLTQYSAVTPYCVGDPDQRWSRKWLVVWRRQAIINNISYLRAILQAMFITFFRNMCSKITLIKFSTTSPRRHWVKALFLLYQRHGQNMLSWSQLDIPHIKLTERVTD